MDKQLTPAEHALREAAREYHRTPTRGKISVTPTKPLSNQRDLARRCDHSDRSGDETVHRAVDATE